MQLSGQVLKILTFNICEGGNSIIGIDSGSPLFGRPRHADIAGVILKSGADIVGDIPSDSKVFENQVLETISIPDTYQKTWTVYSRILTERDKSRSRQ
jgi:hypothetical protein